MKDAALKTSGLLAAGQTAAVLGRSLAVRGELSGNEDLLIEGQFDGTINVQGRRLTVAPGAQVKANIQARWADIHGSLSGNVSASEKIEVRKTAHVTGDLVTAGVVIEDGASFKGSIEIVQDGTSAEQDASSSSAGKEGV
jgi:cytoskeletal protein CcmA (bactofilin family)